MDEKQLIDDLEKESMLELEVMHESENTDNERIIEDAKSKIEKLFDDVRDLLKDASDPEKVKEALSQAKDDVKDAISAEVVEGTRLIEVKVKSDNEKDVKRISKEVLPVFQKVVQKDLGRNKLVIADHPSKITMEQTKSVKKFTVVGAVGGFIIAVGILFIIYLVNLCKKAKESIA